MATVAESERPTVIPAVAGVPFKLSWSAIFGGAFVALGVWILLYCLGLALGLSSVNPNNPGSAKSAGIGTGIWSLIAPLIALFIGGFVAARTAGVLDKAGGAMHGAVLWGLTTLTGVILMGMVLSSLMGAVFNVGKTAVGAAGTAVVGAASQGGEAAKTFGLDANDALGPVNQRLTQEGKPTVTAAQLKAATSDVLNTAVRTGQLDRETLVTAIANNTKLSRQDAEDVANRVEQQFNQTKGQVQQKAGEIGQQVQQGALQAADTTGRVFWGIFGALLLGLVSAVLGATIGVSRRQRVYAEGALAPRREAYP
ncbi:hypothetical protein JY651_32375 [Pyxidicoccus parkwayensis]|uniref:PhnA-like protein n=1 Tax=Pyxidicoccus parkwayensis TaxID=2813578 RepID=A0ABX7NV08_9BACT|nr:hypothetical protein [Pyxidicoccus parkwaysis]QSQ19958.1 hypothetical protein JY651_32375 [Pyxidicoccus parkwaysis]